ncbi:uncharacterized protein HMPREF1541_11098 [Cyphellophora europaea CBS 101466]|uniref:Nodulin-like domain-containing protein n=1 Tax=Cyphellophora europaea (strain CBS 101466) TaxID=1220924 RepID=W2S761_CYPE1|nr:uncharacterized protein HMPREF1541_11098 [Cyphellophora europaea CBS 101466]ETN43774.1 hypothetical protein HMPREF1541_11098 [Cyphellophora europaea CBS 101466]
MPPPAVFTFSSDPKRTRLISVIAATVISLACGTNYVYSAWAPQFAQRLQLSATQSNLIGTFGNLGMYASGIPLGIMVDAKSPRWGVALGIVLFCAGYFPIAQAYDAGPGAYSMPVLCLFSFFTGAGSCSAFTASIKVAAVNYPESRGTATAFPLAAFGLSALFFAVIALAIPHDTYSFLVLLATGTVALPILSFPFLNTSPPHSYSAISRRARRRKSSADEGPVIDSPSAPLSRSTSPPPCAADDDTADTPFLSDDDEASPEDLERSKTSEQFQRESPDYRHLDVRGWSLVYLPRFWLIFCLLGLLTGIGLMTINNIGNVTVALWKHSDRDVAPSFITRTQSMHVSILSFCSFCGRLLSGIGSDYIGRKYHASRFWCLIASSALFCAAQYVSIILENPHLLILISSITGVGYGMLFGVYPSIVADAFGIHGLSQNWGTMTLAPVISGNIFNILYGRIYDSHSIVEDNGDRNCVLGRECYESAYVVTLFAAVGALVLSSWAVWRDWREKKRDGRRHVVVRARDHNA